GINRIPILSVLIFFFSSRRRHTSLQGDWSSDVCSSDLGRVRPGSSGLLSRWSLRGVALLYLGGMVVLPLSAVVAEGFKHGLSDRSEERRVGKECRMRRAALCGSKRNYKAACQALKSSAA